MTYSATKIRKIRWGASRYLAHKILLDHKITDFPLDIISIIQSYPNLKVTTYRKMAIKLGRTMEEIIFANSSPDGSIHYNADSNKYFIAYNDEVENKERMYWTLAHEFGHYVLGHHIETGKTILSRDGLTDEEYDLYEKEADYFTRFLINPPSIIKEWNYINYERVMEVFKVSKAASKNTLKYLNGNLPNGRSLLAPRILKNQLANFIQRVNLGKKCVNCDSLFILQNATYCPICGNKRTIQSYKGDDCNMKYPGVDLTQNGKAVQCPRCTNDVIYLVGDFCPICGVLLVNKCTNVEKDFNGNVQYECEQALPGNSRYCHICGYESSFLANNFLEQWEDTLEREKLPF